MSKQESDNLLNAGFIPGIYNFCDHWCEKCRLKSRCLSFVMEKKVEEKNNGNFEEGVFDKNENVWEFLKLFFDSTYEFLEELAKERGMEVEDLYTLENEETDFLEEGDILSEEGDQAESFVEYSDMIKICMIYEALAEECLDAIFGILDEKEWLEKGKEVRTTDRLLDVINWYLDIIQPKVRRALYGYVRRDSFLTPEAWEMECNGSAKVALISIARSERAWKGMRDYCPSLKKDIAHLLVVLNQLKGEIKLCFPQAASFRRPGFDK